MTDKPIINLKDRLYDKGFTLHTMPSVKRPEQALCSGRALGATLASFKVRSSKLEPVIVKPQSIVFPTEMVRIKRSDTRDKLQTIPERVQRPETRGQSQGLLAQRLSPIEPGVSDEFLRQTLRTPNLNEGEMKRTKFLVQKISGKYNIDRRYEFKPERLEEQIKEEEEALAPALDKPRSCLDQYIHTISRGVSNVDKYIYAIRDPTKDSPYDLEAFLANKVRGQERSRRAETRAQSRAGRMVTRGREEQGRGSGDYYTISKKGVCHYIDGRPVEFIKLGAWLNQRATYNEIKSLKFFTKFRKWKTLKKWRENVIRYKKSLCTKALVENLFLLNPELRGVLLEVRTQTFKMETLRLVCFQNLKSAQTEVTYSIEAFRLLQSENQVSLKKTIGETSDICREIVSGGFKRLSESLRNTTNTQTKMEEENRRTTKNLSSHKEEAYEKLGFDSNMDYDYRSRLRKECSRFLRFAYLVDFVAMESLKNIFLNSILDIEHKFQDLVSHSKPLELKDVSTKQPNRATDPLFVLHVDPCFTDLPPQDLVTQLVPQFQPPPSGTSTIDEFNVLVHVRLKKEKPRDPNKPDEEVEYEEGAPDAEALFPRRLVPDIHKKWLRMSPTAEQFLQCTMQTIKEAVGSIQVFQRWSRHPAMMVYVNILEEWDDKVGEDWENLEGNFLNPNDWIDKNNVVEGFNSNLRRLLEDSYRISEQLIRAKFNPFLQAYWEHSQVDLEIYKDDRLYNPGETIQYSIELFQYQKDYFARQLPNAIEIGLFRLDTSSLRAELLQSPEKRLSEMNAMLPPWLEDVARALKSYIVKSKLELTGMASHINDFVRQNNCLKEILKRMPKVKDKVSLVGQVFSILEISRIQGAQGQQQGAIKEAKEWKNTQTDLLQNLMGLQSAIHSAEEGAERNLQRFARDVTTLLLPNLEKEIAKIDGQVQQKKYLTRQIEMDQAIAELREYDEAIRKCEEDAKRYAHYEETLNLPPSRFQNLSNLRQAFNLRFDMWNSLKEWKELTDSWINGKFNEIATEEIKSKSEKYSKIVARCVKNLPPNPVLEELKKLLNTFKNTMPIVLALRNPYLEKEYHWRQIKERVGKEFDVEEEGFTLKNLIALDLEKYQEEIIEISTQARQERVLKEAIDENRQKWEKLTMEIVPYKHEVPKNKDCYILVRVDLLYAGMDELLANFNNILGSRYLKRFRKSAEDYHREVMNAQEIMDDWMVVQKNWIYLESIFSSSDIKLKLKEENASFENVNKFLSGVMKKAYSNKLLCKNLSTLDQWRKNKEALAQIEKALENYLEDKRNEFPRFYFLSNDELIEFLAKAQDVEAVQRNIRKCFEAVERLELPEDGGKNILGLVSVEKEHLVFSKYTTKNTSMKGEVELWLNVLESALDESLRKAVSKGCGEEQGNRRQFIESHLGQVSAVLGQISWTNETEYYLEEIQNIPNGIYDVLQNAIKSLDLLTALIREDLLELTRRVVIALITQEVHNRDVLETLDNEGVVSKADFLWVQQLRYYLMAEEGEANNLSQNVVVVRQINAELKYGYEYLGATSRLVITPLTDRCWMTITGALNIKLGAAPAGPAGTGKTESTKDLAKGLGMLCVVFNCSEQIEYRMMGRLFTGLAQQGAWACLDEFNRIDIEVLSVIAQQLQTIKVAQHRGETRFLFLERQIGLKPGYGVFTTMNPGYAGRTQLPDNLKILFRSVSMMIPDYRLIAEIMLFAEGFQSAKALSKKMVQLYKLSSEQLSQQDHYDFGMRAVKSVLVMAGALKRAEKELSEEAVLIRAMRDANIPKFVKEDLPLFSALISDLFPRAEASTPDYAVLREQLEKSSLELGLTPVPAQASKVIQLFDTFNVRFGVMLVGLTMSGKTSCFKLLQHASSALRKKGGADPRLEEVGIHIMNPKAISMGELYGSIDKFSQEWQDGLASSIIRQANGEEGPGVTWVVFDGIVDALWIENMNTVLDDNRMLCLANGERIKLKPTLRMLFEVNDLKVASPATVSRCGMVYLNYEELDWRPYVLSWLRRGFSAADESGEPTEVLNQELKQYLFSLMEKAIDGALAAMRAKKVREIISSAELQLVISLCSLVEILLREKESLRGGEKVETKKRLINYAFTLAFIWSFCVTAESSQHDLMSNLCRDLFQSIIFPNNDNVQLFYLDQENSFKHWNERLAAFVFEKDVPFHSLFVETVDSLRYNYALSLLYANRRHVLLNGSSGTGKSTYLGRLPTVVHTLTSTTSSLQLQLTIEGRLQKIKKTLLGAKPGQINIVAVDDVNMPEVEEYGAMPPVEVLRTIVDKMSLWDRKERFLKHIENTVMVCACAPPGGGRNPLPMRFTRHFHLLSLPDTGRQVLGRIFRSLVEGFFQTFNFQEAVKRSAELVTNSTIEVYQRIRKEKLPIPAKFHYTFNLRDISRVVQGVLQVKSNVVRDVETLSKLWLHEVSRVFGDRLCTASDRTWFKGLVFELLENSWKMRALRDEYDQSKIVFGDLLRLETGREYEQITDYRKLVKVLDDKLDEFNSENHNKLNLVFFADAIDHVARIARVLRLSRGNMLLIGMGGSGKQSLTRFSAFLNGYSTLLLEITKGFGLEDFRKFIREKMRAASSQDRHGVFVFNDSQILSESFLEDVSNILNSGEIPNLWSPEEADQLYQETKPFNKLLKRPEDPETVYRTFVERVRERLHVVLAMSPVGDSLRVRCRKFPGLVDCCTLNWFSSWPADALVSVAQTVLDNIEELPVPNGWQRGNLVSALADLCKEVHLRAEAEATLFEEALKRKVYTTPKSYLDMLKLFIQKVTSKSKQMATYRAMLSGGLGKLEKANSQVAVLEVELNVLEPELEKKGVELAQMHGEIERDSKMANEFQKKISGQAEEMQARAVEIKEIRDEASVLIEAILPKLREATERLKSIQKSDIDVIKGYSLPPEPVIGVMECASILLNGKSGDWKYLRGLVIRIDEFVDSMRNINRDNIPEDRLRRVRAILTKPSLTEAAVNSATPVALHILKWVKSMDEYCKSMDDYRPKKAKVDKLQAQFDAANAQLKEKQDTLAEARAKVQFLTDEARRMTLEQRELEEKRQLIKARKLRAGQLLTLTKEESARWKQSVAALTLQAESLVGDVFMAVGETSYNGPFTGYYRRECIESWLAQVREKNIPISESYSLVKCLGRPMEIRDWQIKGLPSDTVSIENSIIATQSLKFPLLIDPQLQALRWLKNAFEESRLRCVRLEGGSFLAEVRGAVKNGKTVVVEDVELVLPAILEQVLGREVMQLDGVDVVKFGDDFINFDREFQIFFCTKLPNPQFLPEVFNKVNVINFTATEQGLEEQLLALVVANEREEVERQRDENIVKMAGYRKLIVESEQNILRLLERTDSSKILDDLQLIETLQNSKRAASEIELKMRESQTLEAQIEEVRALYTPISTRGALLYFVIKDLALIDPMYQYSLQYTMRLFQSTLQASEQSSVLERRLQTLLSNITSAIYTNVTRGLFQQHKLIFSTLIASAINRKRKVLSLELWNLLLRGPSHVDRDKRAPNPNRDIFSESAWDLACGLDSGFAKFLGLVGSLSSNLKEWVEWSGEEELMEGGLPGGWEARLDLFDKVLLVRVLRPQKVMFALSKYVEKSLGKFYLQSPSTSVKELWEGSDCQTPIIFVLSPGADPISSLLKFAQDKGFDERTVLISLGQGQGVIAETQIAAGKLEGRWLVLQNCHLAKSWMPSLEQLIAQNIQHPEEIHAQFRLFLTSMPASYFPVSILQNGVKITTEPPRGLKNNLRRSWGEVREEQLEACPRRRDELHKIEWGLSFFHALVQERRKFGALGWNIRYEFNMSDLQTSRTVVAMLLNEQQALPWDAIVFIVGQINYGGRVTDDWDRRCLMTILRRLINPDILEGRYHFAEEVEELFLPEPASLEQYRDYIEQLPLVDNPEAFGMHDNANITFEAHESDQIIATLLSIQPRPLPAPGTSSESKVLRAIADISAEIPSALETQRGLPELFQLNEKGLAQSLTTVLLQEVSRFNVLLQTIRTSLVSLRRAIEGEVIMSQELDYMFDSLLNNQVPRVWAKAAYPSLKPLRSWIRDLKDRVAFMSDWLYKGAPFCFWLSGFFFPQGFLTGSLQSHARQPGKEIPIDELVWTFKFLEVEKEGCAARPAEGALLYGLFLEGAGFDRKKKALVDSASNQMYVAMPVIHFIPFRTVKDDGSPNFPELKSEVYNCPVYKTTERAGLLSTTGQSTNFVLAVDVPAGEQAPDFWVLRGTALFCQLSQ